MLRGLGDFAGLDATGTNLHSFRAALGTLNADRLQVGIETAGRTVVRVGNVVPKLRSLAADFASFSHNFE